MQTCNSPTNKTKKVITFKNETITLIQKEIETVEFKLVINPYENKHSIGGQSCLYINGEPHIIYDTDVCDVIRTIATTDKLAFVKQGITGKWCEDIIIKTLNKFESPCLIPFEITFRQETIRGFLNVDVSWDKLVPEYYDKNGDVIGSTVPENPHHVNATARHLPNWNDYHYLTCIIRENDIAQEILDNVGNGDVVLETTIDNDDVLLKIGGD